VLDVVALVTQQFQVIVIKCNAWVVDVPLTEIYLVVHNLTASPAPFAQSMHPRDITRPASLPRF
jgi:hypothetical protein